MLADSQRVMLLTATTSYVQFYHSLCATDHSVTEIFDLNRSFHRSLAPKQSIKYLFTERHFGTLSSSAITFSRPFIRKFFLADPLEK